ncbi:MAG: MBL fold metallo-hydrolase [Deltaproteobacteria bacterium]|nr:MBL fold metallo-hydrolase [Deltaproteobacteria bacterium]
MLEIRKLQVTPFAQNARVLWCSKSKEAVVVDPGGDLDSILRVIESKSLQLNQIWLTHSHLDHCGGVAALKQHIPCVLCAHEAESWMRASVDQRCSELNMPAGLMENCPEPEKFIGQGDILELGDSRFQVLFAPGHSPGHLCFYSERDQIVLTGDLLFAGSIGRSDLKGSNVADLQRSLKEVLMTLPDTTKVLAGHGPDTTIGAERTDNPFLKEGGHGWL